ncbi:hypothetical protein JTB14_005559 [Gonioctena quinquepunctata]|nr:hypothetical protein JTB14_005559 [Gonioctena quinquepunctata]
MTAKNLMEYHSYSVEKYLKSDKIMDKFNTVFGQAENYNMDRNSKIIPTPKYLLSLMEGQSYSVGKYMKSNKVEDEVGIPGDKSSCEKDAVVQNQDGETSPTKIKSCSKDFG